MLMVFIFEFIAIKADDNGFENDSPLRRLLAAGFMLVGTCPITAPSRLAWLRREYNPYMPGWFELSCVVATTRLFLASWLSAIALDQSRCFTYPYTKYLQHHRPQTTYITPS